MKKALILVILLFTGIGIFPGCIKNTPYVTTIQPYMTAQMGGNYTFTAKTVVPSLLDTQTHDSTTTLIITGNSSDLYYYNDQLILTITKWKKQTGVFSIIQGQASANFFHDRILDPTLGGIVAVTKITPNAIIGYFSFNTLSGMAVTNGEFNVGLPWNYH